MAGMTLKSPDETVFYPDLQILVGGRFVTPNYEWNTTLRLSLRAGWSNHHYIDLYHKLIQAGF